MGKLGKVAEISIDLLRPYENNAKMHSEEQIQQIANSIKEFGFINPCLIDKDNNIIAGHGRVEGAKLLGMKKVPCIYVEGLTDTQRRAYILADNKLTELGGWDMSIVIDELDALELDGFDIDLTGFEKPEDVSYIDTLLDQGYGSEGKELTTFNIDLTFPLEYREAVTTYIRENGKSDLAQAVLEVCLNAD